MNKQKFLKLLHSILVFTIISSLIPPTPAIARSPQATTSQSPVAEMRQLPAAAPNYSPALFNFSTTNAITITTNGLEPEMLTTTVGAKVTWHNATGLTHTLQSGQPRQIFLPIILKSAGAGSGSTAVDEATSASPLNIQSSSETFSGTVSPGGTFTYTFSATGTHNYFLTTAPQFSGQVIVQESQTLPIVTLQAAPISGTVPLTVTFIATASHFAGALTYTWNFGDGITNTTSITTNGAITTTHSYTNTGLYTATLSVNNKQGDVVTEQVTITVNSALNITLGATPISGTVPLMALFTANCNCSAGEALTYTWDFGDGITQTVPITTSTLVTTTRFYPIVGVYTAAITVSNGEASAGATQTITVNHSSDNLPPNPADVALELDHSTATDLFLATQFLYAGNPPIQTGVVPGTIKPDRVAILRGQVSNRAGEPLPGVTITILNHPEYGQTLSREDGMFDMVVNGGGLLTVDYSKPGYLFVQRQIEVPWQIYTWLPDVVMIPYDNQVTIIDTTNAADFQVAQGSVISDTDGGRQATMLFPNGIQAEMTMPDGTIKTLTTLNVRATEYTVGDKGPAAMSGDLPPNSGYTYAVELSVDEAIETGAKNIQFDHPLYFYLQNFLDFPIGEIAPAGYYDKEQGRWIASDNGQVIKILNITNDLAEIDTDGDAIVDNGLGITEAERRQLAELYEVNQMLWRIPMDHFTAWDINWGAGPPEDATSPDDSSPDDDNPVDNPFIQCGSIIECQNQILGEAINITGTPLTLHYQSERVLGRVAARTLNFQFRSVSTDSNSINSLTSGVSPTLPPSPPPIPPQLILSIEVAGKSEKLQWPLASAPMTYTWTWDGRDAYSRTVQGVWPAKVSIGHKYQCVRQRVARFGYNGGGAITGARSGGGCTVVLWKHFESQVYQWDARGQGLGGWDLDAHHTYDPRSGVLLRGDGKRRNVESLSAINTVAGTGSGGSSGDGGPGTNAQINYPQGIATGPDGSVYIAEYSGNRIRQVKPDGVITTVVEIHQPVGVAVGPDGSIYFSQTYDHVVQRLAPDRTLSIVAGTGAGGYSGDEGSATLAELNQPWGIALGPDGSLYIADKVNHRVRRVGSDGIITTVAGDGTACPPPWTSCGDGVLATGAQLVSPMGVAIGPKGRLYIADRIARRIRRVEPTGIITTTAGGGGSYCGEGNDGEEATNIRLDEPFAIAISSDGGYYISDSGGSSSRICRVRPDGTIMRVAGGNGPGYTGDGVPATKAKFFYPKGIALGPEGNLYVADQNNHRVRLLAPSIPGNSVGDVTVPSEDGRELYVFDELGRHARTLNGLTGAILHQFTYDDAGRLATIQDGEGNVTTVERDGNGQPIAVISPYGQRTALTLNADGYLEQIIRPGGQMHSFTYQDEGGLLTGVTKPGTNETTFSYDEGRLSQENDAATGFTNLARVANSPNFTVTKTSAEGRETRYRVEQPYDGIERHVNTFPSGLETELLIDSSSGIESSRLSDGTEIVVEYGPDPRWGLRSPLPKRQTVTTPGGLQLTITTEQVVTLANPSNPLSLQTMQETETINNRAYTRFFDAAGRTFTHTTPQGRQSFTVVDTQTRVLQEQAAGLAPANYEYDNRGRLAAAALGAGPGARTTTFNYNSQGYLDTITDPLSRAVDFTYDAAGRVTQQTLPGSRVIGYGYDANDNLTSITPPGQPAHTFTYNSVDLLAGYTPPNVGAGNTQTTYTYNADQQLTQVTRPDGQTIVSDYDSAGRLDTVTLPRGTIDYSYHPATGQLTTIVDPGGITLTHRYDGELLTDTTWTGPISGSVSYIYNNDFRVTDLHLNGGYTTNFQYDNDGLLTQAGGLVLSHNTQNGLLLGATLNNVSDNWNYNSFGEVISYSAGYSGALLYTVNYAHDKLGRIITKTETISSATAIYSYDYDLSGRLSVARINGTPVATYTYDSNGNRLSYTNSGGTANGSYDAQDRLLQYGTTTYTYTANGELQSKTDSGQTTIYNYDVLGNLLGVTLPSGVQIEYLVDGLNRRVGKKVNGSLTQGFLYQDDLNPVAELDGSGNIAARFIYANRINVPDHMIKGGVTYRIIADQLGSPRLVVNAVTGEIAQRLDYDEFGNVILDTNPGFQPFGFAGGIYDADTGLVRFGARDYDAEVGRWTAKDPIRFESDGTNLYEYARNDPINFIDLRGQAAGVILGIGLGIGFAIFLYDAYQEMKETEKFREFSESAADRMDEIQDRNQKVKDAWDNYFNSNEADAFDKAVELEEDARRKNVKLLKDTTKEGIECNY